jgi:predicted nucleic acid-binding Zn ribbon protein
VIQTEERRTFEQRYGTHCPFCGKSWGDPGPCGDGAEWSIRDSLKMLFAGNRSKDCAVCPRAIPMNATYCADHAPVRRGNRHAWREKHCEWCGTGYMTQKQGQRYCSLSCGNRARARAGREEQAA